MSYNFMDEIVNFVLSLPFRKKHQYIKHSSTYSLTGADVNLKNDGGRTALHYAASKGWLKIAEILISHGAKINLKDKVYNMGRLDMTGTLSSMPILLSTHHACFNNTIWHAVARLAAPRCIGLQALGILNCVNF